MKKKRALIIIKADPPRNEKEWNESYNDTYISALLAIPGFLSARIFTLIEGIPKQFVISGEPKYLILCDLANTKVLKSKPYLDLREKETSQPSANFEVFPTGLPKFACGVYEQIYTTHLEYQPPHTKCVFVVGHEVPRNKNREFNTWYDTEHLPALLRVPGIVTARRFIRAKGELSDMPISEEILPEYLTTYDIKNTSLFDTKAFKEESNSPWSDWVRSWYTRKMCAVYSRIYPKK